MAALIRTDEQIKALIAAIKAELVGLPDYNIWRESTEDSKADCREWLGELFHALIDSTVQETGSEIEVWLTNERSYFGKDYGVE